MDSPFGCWCLCSDALAHYRLGGALLCGSRACVEREGVPRMRRSPNGERLNPPPGCPECHEANALRWAAARTGGA